MISKFLLLSNGELPHSSYHFYSTLFHYANANEKLEKYYKKDSGKILFFYLFIYFILFYFLFYFLFLLSILICFF